MSNIFGKPPQSQTPNLLGSIGGSTLVGSGLFGGLGQTSAAPQQQQQQPPAGGSTSLFGASNAATGQQTSQSSLFGQSTQPQQSQQQSQPQHQGQSQNQQSQGPPRAENNTQPARFQDLLERGKKQQSNGVRHEELPSLQLGLGDISSRIRNLTSKDAGDSKADYLLAGSGVPRGSTRRNLDAFGAHAGASGLESSAPFDSDIEAYVDRLRAKSTLDIINESMEQTKRDFDSFLDDHIQMNLEVQRRRVYEHFGLARPSEDAGASFASAQSTSGPSASRGAFGRSSRKSKFGSSERGGGSVSFGAASMNRSILGGSTMRGSTRTAQFADVADKPTSAGAGPGPQDPFLRSKQDKYAAKVRELNISRLQQAVYPVIEEFAKVELDSGSDTSTQLVDAYKALKAIVREDPSVQRPSDPGAIKERQYIKSYLDDSPGSGTSLQMRKQILDGSRKFLEDSFFASVEDVIARNPQQANLGGIPSKVNKVRAYVRLRGERKDLTTEKYELQMLNSDYCWALIYYLLRAGLVQEAARYVGENERAIKSMDRHFTQYIKCYAADPDGRLPRDVQTRISAEYQQRTRIAPENSIDPYRMACYKVIGRCDIGRKTIEGVSSGIEDFLWLNFSLAREVNRVEEAAAEVFGLDEVRGIVAEVGQRHFAPGSENGPGYATFFLMQILAGMFEQAIAWLYPHNYVAAVHFAIALDFYGLLRVSDFDVSASELLTYTTRQKPQISFCRLMGYYTQDFRVANAEAATDYLTLICINADLPGQTGKAQAAVCHEALKELVLVTREFALLLGDMSADGRRIEGAIEQRVNLLCLDSHDEFLKTLTIQAASAADDSGRTTDAVLLYHLAEEYDNVVVIINRALSDALAVDIGQEPMRLQPLKPRDAQAGTAAQPDGQPPNTSLSLTSVDDPAVLARNMISLYNANAAYYAKIRQANRDACGLLLRVHDIKTLVANAQWALAIDTVKATALLPLEAEGNVSVIRAHAQQLHALPAVVARNIGSLLVWTITACGRHREVLRGSAFDVGARALVDGLATMAKDLMVFAGLIRYKLSPGVFEVLARAGQGVDG